VLKPQGHLYLADWVNLAFEDISEVTWWYEGDKRGGLHHCLRPWDRDVAYIAYHFTEEELVFLLVENGFEVEYF